MLHVRVLGIDPGSNATGYALVERVGSRFRLEEARVIRTPRGESLARRLLCIHAGLTEAIARLDPDGASIEAIFQHRSSESALRLGHARGVALLAIAQAGLEVTEYNAATVKKVVGGHGRASKPAMVRMVSRLLGLDAPLPADAADAAAIAMTHLASQPLLWQIEHAEGLPPRGRP